MKNTLFREKVIEFVAKCELDLKDEFAAVDKISFENFSRILSSMKENGLAARHFSGTTGYGYDDLGRIMLAKVFADAFECESAYVSPHITSGTHAITAGLFAVLRPGDLLLSVSGRVYDTMETVICGTGNGSLKDFGIDFSAVDLIDGDFDYAAIEKVFKKRPVKVVFIQRSRGYCWRNPLKLEQIAKFVRFVKNISSETVIFVDNCYGEFTDVHEPTYFDADLIAGSLIKNPGGGIAQTGGYIAGRSDLVELAAKRLTAPSTGSETGSYYPGYLPFFQGLFQAPHTVAQAIKGGMLFVSALSKLGFKTLPNSNEKFDDIICSVEFSKKEDLLAFCRAIQAASPVDSFVTPEPSDMPGYECEVVMAAGCFVQGSSIELSCDSPMKEPYIAYLQGGLSLEHCKFALMMVLESLNLTL